MSLRFFFTAVFPSLNDGNILICHLPTTFFASTNIFLVFQKLLCNLIESMRSSQFHPFPVSLSITSMQTKFTEPAVNGRDRIQTWLCAILKPGLLSVKHFCVFNPHMSFQTSFFPVYIEYPFIHSLTEITFAKLILMPGSTL